MSAAAQVSAETLTFEGTEPLKSLPVNADAGDAAKTVRVGAYAIRFADRSEKDLTGDYFTKATDFGPRAGDGVATMFNHGIPIAKGAVFQEFADKTFGPVKTTLDDLGLFAETTLDLSDKYQAAIADLCARGKLKWSTGTAAHILRKSAEGEIQRWHIAEASLTPTPAEPRLPAIVPLKSLQSYEAALDGPTPPLSAQLADAFQQLVDTPEVANPPAATAPTLSSPIMTAEEKAAAEKAQTEAISAATKARLLEVNEITALGNHFKCVEVATSFIAEGKSLNDFRQHVLENVKKATPVVIDPALGMPKKDRAQWSIVKAIREIAENGFNPRSLSGVEKEASDATAKRLGLTCKGFFIPHDVASANIAQDNDLGTAALKALISQAAQLKTLNATSFAQGGALIGTELMTGSMIELLRNKPLVAQMGARTMTGLVGNIAIPRLNGGATTYWVNEQGAVTDSDQVFGQLGLTPKKLAGRTGYTKELLSQTDLSVEAIVRDDLMIQLGLAKDLAALNGTGGAQPLGIMNQPVGLNSVTFNGTANRASAIAFQRELAIDNATRGALAYMTTPSVAAKWMGIPEVANYPVWLWAGNVDTGMVVGRRAESTNQVPNDRVIYGNWNDLILADWAGIDVVVNPYSNDSQGIVKITIFLLTDVGVRQLVSFCVSTDAGNQ